MIIRNGLLVEIAQLADEGGAQVLAQLVCLHAIHVGAEEVDEVVADAVVLRVVVHGAACAVTRHGVLHNFCNSCTRTVAHQHDFVGQQNRFIHIVGNHNGGYFFLVPDFNKDILKFASGQRIQHPERFVQQ